jgi:hypothetical protein
MVRRFSVASDRILRLRAYGVDRGTARDIVSYVAGDVGIEPPEASFHRGRGPHTGYCMPPRRVVAATTDDAWLSDWEATKRRSWPEHGMIRLGDPTALGTIAHELAHHMVHMLDPDSTPAHGRRWVERFDAAAVSVASFIGPTFAGF